MARSAYIYAVFFESDRETAWGCFTVKHEMKSAIRRSGSKKRFFVERYRDGQPGSCEDITKEILIEMAGE